MNYLGGKYRAARHITEEIRRRVGPSARWWDPFCGGLSMSRALTEVYGAGLSSDVCVPLVALYQATVAGWQPPARLSREEHKAARALPDLHPLKAFAGFGCSFAGSWLGGYGGEGKALRARRALLRDTATVRQFMCLDFLAVQPTGGFDVLYLDPPYLGTAQYDAVPPFKYEKFVQRALQWARAGVHVFVSEYAFPHGKRVWQMQKTVSFGSGRRTAVERLFYIRPKYAQTLLGRHHAPPLA